MPSEKFGCHFYRERSIQYISYHFTKPDVQNLRQCGAVCMMTFVESSTKALQKQGDFRWKSVKKRVNCDNTFRYKIAYVGGPSFRRRPNSCHPVCVDSTSLLNHILLIKIMSHTRMLWNGLSSYGGFDCCRLIRVLYNILRYNMYSIVRERYKEVKSCLLLRLIVPESFIAGGCYQPFTIQSHMLTGLKLFYEP